MEEQFKYISGWNDFYLISNFGNVYSKHTNKILTKNTSNQGYHTVTLCKKDFKKIQSVHRLVAIAFIPNPKNKPEVNHINGIKKDNNVSNLEWVTKSENCKHAYKTGLSKVHKTHLGRHEPRWNPVKLKKDAAGGNL